MTDLAALLQAILASKKITIIIEDGQPMVQESFANAQTGQHSVRCERCKKLFVKDNRASAERALRSHRYHCQRKPLPKPRGLLEQIEQMHRKNGAYHEE